MPPSPPVLAASRYVWPLREGGSLPALVELEDGRLVVLKFRGAGQGARALVAEWIVGELGRAYGLRVPELVWVDLDPAFGKTEGDPEIQDLLRKSAGLNLGLAFLSGSVMFDPGAQPVVSAEEASAIVAFDAFSSNVDRTARNPNLLWWHDELWLIDHGAALYWHHAWDGSTTGSDRPFVHVRDHVLLPWADALPPTSRALAERLTDPVIDAVVDVLPDAWLEPTDTLGEPEAQRRAYADYLRARRDAAPIYVEEAIRARASRV